MPDSEFGRAGGDMVANVTLAAISLMVVMRIIVEVMVLVVLVPPLFLKENIRGVRWDSI